MESESRFPERIALGVMGSSGGRIGARARARVRELGREAARRGWILVTGACPGLPHEAVLGAREAAGTVIGISPALNLEEHLLRYRAPFQGYDAIIYTGSGLMGREIENIRSCDMVVFAGGRSGTLGEFAIAYDEAKLIGVLTGTGGVSDHLREILGFMEKRTGAQLVFCEEPVELLDALWRLYRTRRLPYLKSLVANRAPDGAPEE